MLDQFVQKPSPLDDLPHHPHHFVTKKVVLCILLFLLPALFALVYMSIYLPLSGKVDKITQNKISTPSTEVPIACTEEARMCPDGSSVGRQGPNCEFTPCPTTANQQSSPEITAITETYTMSWIPQAKTTLAYTDFANGKAYNDIPVATQLEGTGKLITTTVCFTRCEEEKLLSLGWTPDNNQAADGLNGSQWGYTKNENGKTRIIQLQYMNTSVIENNNGPLSIVCPCNVSYTVKMTEPF